MSRWKSPQVAAKRAERAAISAEKIRKQKRITWLLVLCLALVVSGLITADYFFLRYVARKRHERVHPQHQQGTNASLVQTNNLDGPLQKERR